MSPAIFLNQKETKKIDDKSSVAYKALMVMLRELRDRTGVKVSVIGTDDGGSLFELDIDWYEMIPFLAKIKNKKFLLLSDSLQSASKTFSFYFKDKMVVTKFDIPKKLSFKISSKMICYLYKIKNTNIYFTTNTNIVGNLNLSILPIELV